MLGEVLLDVVNHSPIAKSFSINFLSAASALTPAGFFGSRQQPPRLLFWLTIHPLRR
jgi:hypothetical protein